MDWRKAVSVASGAIPSSPTEKQEAYQTLCDTGLGYRLGGKIADTLRFLVASGAVTEKPDGRA